MFLAYSLFIFAASVIAASNCTFTSVTCPRPNFNFCESASPGVGNNIIFRCDSQGCPEPGNCNDNLADVPPFGVKTSASCWQDSPQAGNAQCTFDCVNVTALNGSVFYPLGCDFKVENTTGPPSTTSLSIFATSTTSSFAIPKSTTAGAAMQSIMKGAGTGAVVAVGLLPLLL